MTFAKLVEIASSMNYTINYQEFNYKLILDDNLYKIELTIPKDNILEIIDNSPNINIDWEYKIENKKGKKIHSEWFDYYNGTVENKLQEMKVDIFKYLNNFSKQKFTIIQKSVISLFGIKLLKYNELEFY